MSDQNCCGIYRQGDVLLLPVEELPEGLNSVMNPEDGRLILARGEKTDHHHSLAAKDARGWFSTDRNSQTTSWIEVITEPAALVHQEHSEIVLPVGKYEVRRPREHTESVTRWHAD
jgi:hypothetical protein